MNTKLTLIIKVMLVPIFVLALFENATAQAAEGGIGFQQELPSPTAMSFTKVTDIPVSLFTGQPNVSIPLHNMNINGVNIPVQLNYSTSGLRVEEVSSFVGQGWDLLVGGVITRTLLGFPDESAFGFSNTGNYDFGIFDDTSHEFFIYYLNGFMSDFSYDTDLGQDTFNYNFLGRSGKFYMGFGGNYYLESYDNLKIETIIGGFKFTAEDGKEYEFKKTEITKDANELGDVITAWFLTKVKSPNTSEEVNFYYSSYDYTKDRNTQEVKYICNGLPCLSNNPGFVNSTDYSKVMLDSVVSNTEKVVFEYTERATGNEDEYQIDAIKILKRNVLQTEYEFNYYSNTYRNYLLSVDKFVNSVQTPFYSLEYNGYLSVTPLSKAIDHWGYYNANGGSSLVPSMVISGNRFISGANRTVDPEAIKTGVLEKITYPTGGEDVLEYEPNLCHTTYGSIGSLNPANEIIQLSGDIDPSSSSTSIDFIIDAGSGNASYVEITFTYNLTNYYNEIYVKLDNNTVGILEPDDSPTQNPYSHSASHEVFNGLSSGTHTIDITNSGTNNTGNIHYTIKIHQSSLENKYCSGLRIKSISSSDGVDSGLKTRTFTYLKAGGLSSGVSYGGTGYTTTFPPNNSRLSYATTNDASLNMDFLSIEANPISPVGGLGYSLKTGYSNVRVTYSDGGYEVNEYSTQPEGLAPTTLESTHYWIGPGLLSIHSGQYKVGSLTKKSIYNSGDDLLQQEIYQYKDYESSSDVRVKKRFQHFMFTKYDSNNSKFGFYSNYVVWRHLEKKINRIYNGSGQYLESSIEYHYDDLDNKLLTYEEITNSNGDKRIKRYKYAFEIYNGAGEMEDLNMLSQPYSVTVEDDSGNVLSKNWTLWKVWSDGKWRPCETRVWKGGTITNPTTCTSN